MIKVQLSGEPGAKLKSNLAGLYDRWLAAITTAANMAASMIQTQARAAIAGAGFSGEWVSGLHAQVTGDDPKTNMRISMYHDDPRIAIFMTGGVIKGNPFLWIPLSGTDAQGVKASAYPGLFSARYPRRSGPPLLFAVSDKLPRYFGVESVTIPKKLDMNGVTESVMGNFRQIFDDAWKGAI